MHVESLMTPRDPDKGGPRYHKNGFYRGEVSQGGVGQNAVAVQLVSQLQLRVKRYGGPLRLPLDLSQLSLIQKSRMFL